jgi:uncharacterized protein (TIGR03083 family)
MDPSPSSAVRSTFAESATAFVELVRQIEADAWGEPGLGVWNVRDLVGHASRSFSTIESYLGTTTTEPHLDGPAAYFRAVQSFVLADPEGVAQRGRDAGSALGEDPAASIEALAERVTALVADSADDEPVGTPMGTMTLAGYLPTRVFELTVHSLDLARALDLLQPAGLDAGIRLSLELLGQLAGDSPGAVAVLMTLTGRAELPAGFTLL